MSSGIGTNKTLRVSVIATIVLVVMVVLLLVLVLAPSIFWGTAQMFGAESDTSMDIVSFSTSDGLKIISDAGPNNLEGREPWLGAVAWTEAVQAGQEYANQFPETQPSVRILTELNTEQIWQYMIHISGALGVSCQYCHDLSNFAAYTYPQKAAALSMLILNSNINKEYISQIPEWKGNYVQCATCHYGSPKAMPAVSAENEAHLRQNPAIGELNQTWVDTPAIDPDRSYVLQHPTTGVMLNMTNWMQGNWGTSGTVPQPEEPASFVIDRQHFGVFNENYYAMPGCYTCHRGNLIPPGAINQVDLDTFGENSITVLPMAIRGITTP
ncbi:MAG: photosynthetic reaction center cytochrome c subunit [Chloroflexaceae bacterium]|nr:photosynthetic reaction center cytochrome c subunit [Chloroflexaceae bacterium]